MVHDLQKLSVLIYGNSYPSRASLLLCFSLTKERARARKKERAASKHNDIKRNMTFCIHDEREI